MQALPIVLFLRDIFCGIAEQNRPPVHISASSEFLESEIEAALRVAQLCDSLCQLANTPENHKNLLDLDSLEWELIADSLIFLRVEKTESGWPSVQKLTVLFGDKYFAAVTHPLERLILLALLSCSMRYHRDLKRKNERPRALSASWEEIVSLLLADTIPCTESLGAIVQEHIRFVRKRLQTLRTRHEAQEPLSYSLEGSYEYLDPDDQPDTAEITLSDEDISERDEQMCFEAFLEDLAREWKRYPQNC